MRRITRPPARRRSQTHGSAKRRRHTNFTAIALRRFGLKQFGAQQNLAALAFLFATFILVVLLAAPGYTIKSVDVVGNQGTALQDVQDAVQFAMGVNVFLLHTADVAGAVMRISGVEAADARVLLPDRLQITIKDARPEIAWISASLVYWLDASGVVREPPAGEPDRRITIKDLTGRSYQKGDKVDVDVVRAAQQLSVLMQRDIQVFEYQRDGEIIAVGNQGWRAVFNALGNLNLQADALQRILDSGRTIAYVDVRVPSMVTYR
jgi:cell division septal protein FtsQ